MPKKKQYVVPARLHYDVFSRDEYGNGQFDIEFVCACKTEFDAMVVAQSLVRSLNFVRGRSYVVRARPTEAHNTLKYYCDPDRKHQESNEDADREYLTAEIGQRVIQASVNGNGKPSPTVVKAVQKVLH